jgi:hypothetical protein
MVSVILFSGGQAALSILSPPAAISRLLTGVVVIGIPTAICMGLVAAFTVFGLRR